MKVLVLRRPSTWFLLGAGLLAADRLRWLPDAWTGAALFLGGALFAASLGATLLGHGRTPHRREVEVLVLPLSRGIEPDTRRRVLWFFAFLAASVLLPVAFAMALR